MKPTPASYKTIALSLNRLRTENSIAYGCGRLFTAQDVRNKWHRTFPSKFDTNRAVKYLRDLEVAWPGTKVKVGAVCSDDPGDPPLVCNFHVLFPWASDLVHTVAPNISLDATFNMTIYGYKVAVCVVTCPSYH